MKGAVWSVLLLFVYAVPDGEEELRAGEWGVCGGGVVFGCGYPNIFIKVETR